MKVFKSHLIASVLLIGILIVGCQNSKSTKSIQEKEDQTNVESSDKESFEALYDSTTQSIPIFYNMYLTVEMSSLFEETGVPFDSKFLNPSDYIDNYLTSYKKALNLGVYAVDLSYVKAFQEFDYAGKYFSAMHKLAENLGIPDDFFFNAATRFEKNIGNKDSLAYIANQVYTVTDDYLKENNRESTAYLIIVGGWVEAIYLGLNVYMQSNQNEEIFDKLADQKTSLVKVLDLFDSTADPNDYIKHILGLMKGLENTFDALNADSGENMDQSMGKLLKQVSDVRNEIIK